jgi:hypothetical protein
VTALELLMAEQTIPAPSEKAQQRPNKERRASVRYLISGENRCQPVAASLPEQPEIGWFGRLLDISVGGVGLLLSRSFEAGTLLMLELSDPAHGEPRAFPVRVVHAREEGPTTWRIGCEFIFPLHEEELQALVRE